MTPEERNLVIELFDRLATLEDAQRDPEAERLIKAMRQARPKHVRQFFALANQHMRWELNDLARRLDEQAPAAELRDSLVPAPPESSGLDRSRAGGATLLRRDLLCVGEPSAATSR